MLFPRLLLSMVISIVSMAKKGGQKVTSQQLIELPHKENGEVDWETLGNILTGRILGEVLNASYVDPKCGNKTESFSADTEWRYVSEEHEIVTLKKRMSPDSPLWRYTLLTNIGCVCKTGQPCKGKCCPAGDIHAYFMGRGVIDQPIQKVADFFRTPLSTLTVNSLATESRVVETLSDTRTCTDYIGYVRYEARRCFVKAKRDFVFYMHYVEKDGKCIKTTISVEHSDCPPMPGITRGQFRPGSGWVIERYKGDEHRTLVSFLGNLDLINLQPVIANLILKKLPLQILLLKSPHARYEHTESQHGSHTFSGRHFEDPISIEIFTGRELQSSRNLHPARDFPKRNLEVGTDNAGQISATEDVHVPYKPETDEEQVEPPADLKEPQQGDCSITAT